MPAFTIESDVTVRTFTIKPATRLLIQFDAYFKNTGVYEVQYITVEYDPINDVIERPQVIGRKVAKSSGQYTSHEWRVYNSDLEAKAMTYVERLLANEPNSPCGESTGSVD